MMVDDMQTGQFIDAGVLKDFKEIMESSRSCPSSVGPSAIRGFIAQHGLLEKLDDALGQMEHLDGKRLIIVEGVRYVGKSTLANSLKTDFGYPVISSLGAISSIYRATGILEKELDRDTAQVGFLFYLVSRLEGIHEAVHKASATNSEYVVLDSSLMRVIATQFAVLDFKRNANGAALTGEDIAMDELLRYARDSIIDVFAKASRNVVFVFAFADPVTLSKHMLRRNGQMPGGVSQQLSVLGSMRLTELEHMLKARNIPLIEVNSVSGFDDGATGGIPYDFKLVQIDTEDSAFDAHMKSLGIGTLLRMR